MKIKYKLIDIIKGAFFIFLQLFSEMMRSWELTRQFFGDFYGKLRRKILLRMRSMILRIRPLIKGLKLMTTKCQEGKQRGAKKGEGNHWPLRTALSKIISILSLIDWIGIFLIAIDSFVTRLLKFSSNVSLKYHVEHYDFLLLFLVSFLSNNNHNDRFNGFSFNEAISFNDYMNIKYKFLSLDLEESDSYVLFSSSNTFS